jgi:hexulose-6-phosphate isomerase
MASGFSRRDFLAASAAGVGLAAAGGRAAETAFKTTLHKAVIQGYPSEASLKGLKDAGFEGIECGAWSTEPKKAAEAREVAEKLGMRIHSVMRAWVNFNNPASVEGDIKSVETALKAAQGFGADAILLVPCRIGGTAPQPWEFDIKFDDKTGHITQVVAGDNEKYKAYIETHNKSSDASIEAVRKLTEVAEQTKVIIALENVWNNMWVKPAIFKWFVASFNSPWVGAYFDIGNHVKYAPPEEWLRELGPLTVKLHAKDFKLNPNGRDGNWANIGEGSVNWPAVRAEVEKIGKDLWLTNESGGFSLAEFSRRFDLINQGKDPGGRDK